MSDELIDTADEIVRHCKEMSFMSLHVLCSAIETSDMCFVMIGGSPANRSRMKKVTELLELSNFKID